MMEALLDKYVDILGLSNWKIEIKEIPELEELGSNFIIFNEYSCTIRIRAELSTEEKENTIIHELCHLITRDECDIATENLSDGLGKYYLRHHERATQQFADIIYRLVTCNG